MRAQIIVRCSENLKLPDGHRVTFTMPGAATLVAFCSLEAELAQSEPGGLYEIVVKSEKEFE